MIQDISIIVFLVFAIYAEAHNKKTAITFTATAE
jgi:hypothetical protein